MTESEAQSLRTQIESFEQSNGEQGKEILFSDPHFCVPFLYDLSFNSTILDAVGVVIGPAAWVKDARTRKIVCSFSTEYLIFANYED